MRALQSVIWLAATVFIANTSVAQSEIPVLAWSNVVAVVTNSSAGSIDQENDLKALPGKNARLGMEYVREEKGNDGTLRRLFIHIEPISGDIIFHCWLDEKVLTERRSVDITGTIKSMAFVEKGLRESIYSLEMDVTSFEAVAEGKAGVQ